MRIVLLIVVMLGFVFAYGCAARRTSAAVSTSNGSDAAQEMVRYERRKPETRYDEFKDATSVKVALSPKLSAASASDFMDMSATMIGSFSGRACCAEPTSSFLLGFISSSKTWRFLKQRHLILLLDGERVSLELKHDGSVGRGYVIESLSAMAPFALADKFSRSRSVRGQIGLVEFAFTSDDLRASAEFVRAMTPPQTTTSSASAR